MSRPSNDDGFLLLEVLVAFVIAALALTVLFQGAVGGVRATAIAARYQQGVARARSHLAAVSGRIGDLTPGVQSGDDGSGFRWQVQVTPLGSVPLAGSATVRLVLYRVSVTESWPVDSGRRHVRLTSARLAEQGATAP
jgi:general secretion pathway protein I